MEIQPLTHPFTNSFRIEIDEPNKEPVHNASENKAIAHTLHAFIRDYNNFKNRIGWLLRMNLGLQDCQLLSGIK